MKNVLLLIFAAATMTAAPALAGLNILVCDATSITAVSSDSLEVTEVTGNMPPVTTATWEDSPGVVILAICNDGHLTIAGQGGDGEVARVAIALQKDAVFKE